MMFTVAVNDLRVILRSKWVFSFGLLFTILSTTVVIFGGSDEVSGYEGFNRMTASLLNVSLFLVPLLTMLIGSNAIAGDKEGGSFSLILTYPISVPHIIVGKFLGLFIAMFAVITFGYGVAGVFLAFQTAGISISLYLLFYIFTLLLMFMFLSISIAVGILSVNRYQAIGSSLFIWAASVLFYEFVIMGISMAVTQNAIIPLLTGSILVNPVELIRVWTIIAMGSGSIFGPHLYQLTIWSESGLGQTAFAASAVLWIVFPLLLSILVVKRGIRHAG